MVKFKERKKVYSWGKEVEFQVRDKYKFDISVEHLKGRFPQIFLFDHADPTQCFMAGVEMVALDMATPEEVAESCREARRKEKVPKQLLEQLGLRYDDFLYAYIGFPKKPLNEIQKEIKEKLKAL